MYPRFIDFIKASKAELEAKGHSVELAGIYYHVGENDMAFGPYRRQAAQWLKATIVQSRQDLGQPALKWFISQQPPTDTKDLNQLDVTADLAKLAVEDPHTIHLKLFNLPPQPEKLVITTAGIVQLGEQLAQSYTQSTSVAVEQVKGEMAGYLLVPNEKVPDTFNAGFSMYIAAGHC